MTETTSHTEDDLLTVQEAAKFLSISVSAMNKWRMVLAGPRYINLGRRVRYRRSDLVKYIEGGGHSW